MDETARSASLSILPALWLLPIVFAIHDSKELLTMSAWIAVHRQELDQREQTSAVAARIVRSLAPTTPQVAIVIEEDSRHRIRRLPILRPQAE